MRKNIIFVLLVFCALSVVMMGCSGVDSLNPAVTPTPEIVYVTVLVTPVPTATHCYWDPVKMICSDKPVTPVPTLVTPPTAAPATPAASLENAGDSDPILHRWIRQYSGTTMGYEFQFYSDGTAIYRLGEVARVSGTLKIPTPSVTGSGTWTKLGEGHYLVKVSTPGVAGAPAIVREYVMKQGSGVYGQYLVSDFEQADVDQATKDGTIHSFATDVFYVERVPTD